ncbi:MAG: hypothetical protein V7739_11495 [Motiliproteus sp.]
MAIAALGFARLLQTVSKFYCCPLYVPQNVSTLKRLLHLGSFALSSMIPLARNLAWKPDVVVTVVPTLFTRLNAQLFAALSGAKSVLHIQDYELDAMLGLGLGGAVFFAYGSVY